MILILKILLWILNFCVIWFLLRRTKKALRLLADANEKIEHLSSNINSLHYNQGMLSSSIKELYRELKKHDKNFKRQYYGTQKAGTEEGG
jgi:hypothetical protein